MNGWVEAHLDMDQEEKANEALGALECLHELIAFHDPLSSIRPEPLSYLVKVILYSVRDAMPNGHPKHGRAVNDEDVP